MTIGLSIRKNSHFGLDLVLRGWLTLNKPTDLCGVKLAYVYEEEVGRMTPRSPSALTCLETRVSLVVFFFFSILGQTVDRHESLGAVRSPKNQVQWRLEPGQPELHSPPTLLQIHQRQPPQHSPYIIIRFPSSC